MSLFQEMETYGLADCADNRAIMEQARRRHADILAAYLMRMPAICLGQIHRASKVSWGEALNGNASSQAQAQANERAVIAAAVECMLDSDLLKIERLIEGGKA